MTSSGYQSRVDGYGFTRASDFDHEAYEEFMSSYLPILARRAGRWKSHLGSSTKVATSSVVKRMCRKGIPAEHRSMVWMRTCGAAKLQKHAPSMYEDLLTEPKDTEMMEVISKDVPRSFPGNIFFTVADDPYGLQKPLTNVLCALSKKSPSVPYVSGLHLIVGMLLIVLKKEETSFWLADTIIRKSVPEYFSADCTCDGVNVEQLVLEEVVRRKLPEVQTHLESLELTWSMFTAKWFKCLFADVLPIDTVLRIWDSLFFEGGPIILQAAFTIVFILKDKILKCTEAGNVFDLFEVIGNQRDILHCHTFMETLFQETEDLTEKAIIKMRKKCAEQM